MSANHTYMSAETYLALETEILKLQEGNGQELKKVEQKVSSQLQQMQRSGQATLNKLNQQRRANISQITQAMQGVRDAAADAQSDAAAAQRQLTQLNAAARNAQAQVDQLNEATKQAFATAAQLYQEMRNQFAATRLDVAYQRFASADQASIEALIKQADAQQAGSNALQMLAVSIMNDIHVMDIYVAQQRALFDADYLKATRLAGTILAQCKNVESDAKDDDGKPLDISFWTDGRYALVKEEAAAIQQRLESSYEDPSYSFDDLKKDLARLEELHKIGKQLVAEGIEASRHSLNREAQGLECMNILQEDHHFSQVGAGFDMNDPREAYIVRMKRHTDGALIEVIVNQGKKPGEYEVYFRLDATTYQDQRVMDTINGAIAESFREAGVKMELFKNCSPEPMQNFIPGQQVTVSDVARRRHGIQHRQRPSSI